MQISALHLCARRRDGIVVELLFDDFDLKSLRPMRRAAVAAFKFTSTVREWFRFLNH